MSDRRIDDQSNDVSWVYLLGRVLNGLTSWLPLPAPQSLTNFKEMVSKRAVKVYADVYRRYSPFDGRDVAEIGAGWGFALDHYLSYGPRSYYALDIAHNEAIADTLRDNPMRDKVHVVRITPDHFPLPDECIDVIVSENTFEHAANYEATIAEASRILRSSGRLVALFAPLYFSPYGAHLWHTIKFPWLHLLLKRQDLRRLFYEGELPAGLEFDHDYHWEQFLTLNRLHPREFLLPFRRPGWRLVRVASYPLPLMHTAPEPFSSLLTHGMIIVAEKVG
jgi:SAM-dependent methyltransferase